jgi:hypothetical protein
MQNTVRRAWRETVITGTRFLVGQDVIPPPRIMLSLFSIGIIKPAYSWQIVGFTAKMIYYKATCVAQSTRKRANHWHRKGCWVLGAGFWVLGFRIFFRVKQDTWQSHPCQQSINRQKVQESRSISIETATHATRVDYKYRLRSTDICRERRAIHISKIYRLPVHLTSKR